MSTLTLVLPKTARPQVPKGFAGAKDTVGVELIRNGITTQIFKEQKQ